ncbi:MAG TPA: hypothetical protein DCQ93_03505 [Bacteroidetes bacterium]|nr:hypothetical protein [Bacteroidota bacterium]
MKKILLAVCLISLISLQKSSAQTINIVGAFLVEDTTFLYSSTYLTYGIKNTGLNDFTGNVQVKVEANGDSIPGGVIINNIFIPADSTYMFTGNPVDYFPVTFQTGDNVVVIWPIVNGVTGASDTLPTVYLWDPNSVTDATLEDKVLLASTSIQNQFRIINKSNYDILSSYVYDLSGRMVCSFSKDKKEINLGNISSGLYTLEIKLSEGRKSVFKVMVQ